MKLRLHDLTADWGMKAAALAMSILLWIVVVSEQVTTQWRTVPVQVILRDPALRRQAVANPSQVRVRFSGTGRDLWSLDSHKPTVVLFVPRAAESGLYYLEPQMVRIPARIGVTPIDIDPTVVRLVIRGQTDTSSTDSAATEPVAGDAPLPDIRPEPTVSVPPPPRTAPAPDLSPVGAPFPTTILDSVPQVAAPPRAPGTP